MNEPQGWTSISLALENHAPPALQSAVHPLAMLISTAAAGRFPAADGGWRRVPPWRSGLEGIVAFTGHAVLAVAPDISDERLVELGANGFGGAHDPRLLVALAGPDGWIDNLDVLLAGRGTGKAARAALRPGHGAGAAAGSAGSADGRAGGTGAGPRLVDRPDLAAHPRAQFAAQIRDRRRVLGYPDRGRSALAVISTGLAGLGSPSWASSWNRNAGAQAAEPH